MEGGRAGWWTIGVVVQGVRGSVVAPSSLPSASSSSRRPILPPLSLLFLARRLRGLQPPPFLPSLLVEVGERGLVDPSPGVVLMPPALSPLRSLAASTPEKEVGEGPW